jgi:hypothetical protein
MFRWHRNAATSYMYLPDVQLDTIADGSSVYSAFTQSRWFTRGWTLQELLPTRHVILYDKWWSWLDTKQDLQQRITRVAGIPEQVLEDPDELFKLSAAQNVSWAAGRRTTRTEDMAYCLPGIFGIHMPLLYGEGNSAFYRHQQEIFKTTHHLSLFAWSGSGERLGGILAKKSGDFLGAGYHAREPGHEGFLKGYQGNLRMPLPMFPLGRHYNHKDDFIATFDQRMASTQEEEIAGKESQILAWVISIQESLPDVKYQHSGNATALDRTEEPMKTPLGAPEENSDVRTLFSSHTSSRPSSIMSLGKSSPEVQGTVHDVQITQDEEWATATNNDDIDDFRSESSDSDSESFSTISIDSDDSEDELLPDTFIEVLVEVILERKGMPWHLLDGKRGADANVQGRECGNALYAASSGGHEAIARLLLDKGANVNVNAQNGQYGTALQAASRGGHQQIVKLLLDAGADVNAQGGEYGNALYAASSGGHEAIARLLLDKGANVNAQGGEHGNALYAALSRGHEAIARLLLDKGADVNAQGGEWGNTLQVISQEGHAHAIKRKRLH